MIDAGLVARARDADLRQRAENLGTTLRRLTASEVVGPCPKCQGHDRFAINIRKKIWNCRVCGVGGGVVDLVMHVRGCNFRQAIEHITGETTAPASTTVATAPKAKPEPDEEAQRNLKRAALIVAEMVAIKGTPADRYLRDVRKIDTDAIDDVIASTHVLGWHPAVVFREKGHALDGQRLGAIVGVMTDASTARATGAISRTFVSEGRKIGKAKTLGAPAGIVRLTPDEDVLGGIHLAEGLETALAGMSIGLRPMWATGSTALMSKFPLLSGIESLNLIVDHDPNGAGEKAAREAEERWASAGREVRLLRSDAPGDLNDVIRAAK
jgi:hypothetical protein